MSGAGPILLVVARPDERARLALALRYAGHQVLEARAAGDALERASALQPALAVLDERFAELGSQLKSAAAPARLPVLLLVEAIPGHSAADDLLTKPVNLEELLVRVRGHVYRSEVALPGGAGGAHIEP